MVALLEIREALYMAGCYEHGAPDTLAGLRGLGVPGPRRGEEPGRWALSQAEAWRELAWAIAVNTVSEAQTAAAVTG